MEEKTQAAESPQGNEAAVASATLSDGGAGLAAQLTRNRPYAIARRVYGGALVIVASAAFVTLGLSYLPQLAVERPVAQAAAAETAKEEAKPQDPFAALTVDARAAYVYDVTTDKALFAKNGDVQLPLASITKVPLVLAVSEVLQPEDMVTISQTAINKGGPSLNWGEVWLARDLIEYTLISSSNTGAEALAEAADAGLLAKYPDAPPGRAAIWRMNAIAKELGLKETYFINVTGLDESTTQAGSLGSARDIAALFAYALREHRALFSGTARANETLGPLNFPHRTAINTNVALPDIPGLLMGKTGTTDLAGGNLAIAFEAALNRPVVIVVLGSTDTGRYDDIRKLVEATRATMQP